MTKKYFTLISEVIPHEGDYFDGNEETHHGSFRLRAFDCKLTEVYSFGCIKGVEVSPKTKFIAFLTECDKVAGCYGYSEGALIGTMDTFDLFEGVTTVYGLNGEVIWIQGDYPDNIQPKTLPPQMFGYDPHPWWKHIFENC